MQLVLYRCKKPAGGLGAWVIIQCGGINVGDFLIKLPLRKTDFPDFLQLFLKVFLCQNRSTVFQAFLIHHPALDGIILDDSVCPFAELYGSFIVDLEAHRNDHLQIIVGQLTGNLPGSLGLNCSEFPNGCLLGQLAIFVDFFDVFVDGGDGHII